MILVTGATGNIGFEVTRLLGVAGVACRAMHRSPDDAACLANLGAHPIQASFESQSSLEAAMHGCDKLFLLPPPTPHQEAYERAALAAARRAGVERIIKVSAADANLTSQVPWAKSHAVGEKLLRESRLAWTILRPSAFFQNFVQLADPIKKGFLPIAAGRGCAAYVDARDVAAVAARVLAGDGHDHATYLLTGPEALTMRDIAEVLSRELPRKIRYVDLPKPAYWAALRLAGVDGWLASGLIAQFAGVVAGGHDIAVTEEVERLTNQAPRTFEAFARESKSAFMGG